MQVTGPKIYYTVPVLGGIPITQTAVSAFVVMVILCTAGILLGRNLKKRPDGRQVVVEKLVSMLYGLVEDAMGKHNSHWTPYIGTLFLSSLCGSLIGMTGIFRSTTADLATVGVWALMTTGLCWYWSIRNFGLKSWLKGFAEPVAVMLPINLVSELAQPVSMMFRHFGNILGGSVLTTLLYGALSAASALVLRLVGTNWIVSAAVLAVGVFLVIRAFQKGKLVGKILSVLVAVTGGLALLQSLNVLSGVPYLSLGLPGVLSLYFDVFTGCVQALVFSLLTMVYVGNCCPPPEELAKQ